MDRVASINEGPYILSQNSVRYENIDKASIIAGFEVHASRLSQTQCQLLIKIALEIQKKLND